MCTCQDLCPICVPNVAHPPPLYNPPWNSGGGGKARNFWEIFHLATWNIPPPHVFWVSKRCGGVLRMQHFSPEMVWHTLSFWTYIHTYIHSYIHTFTHSYIYIYTYMYLNTHMYMYIYNILAQTYLQKNATVKFLRGGSCKTNVFYSSSRVPPPKKSIANAGGAPSCFLPLR